MKNPYLSLVERYINLFSTGKGLDLGEYKIGSKPDFPPGSPKAMLFSPHPDDECITGGIALRMMYEIGVQVINVAVTLGSKVDARPRRKKELTKACEYLGFDLQLTIPDGLSHITVNQKTEKPDNWANSIEIIKRILIEQNPDVIFIPHQKDWNKTHCGVHFLVMDALKELGEDFSCLVIETEYWGALENPNLMVELSVSDVTELMAATSLHAEEVKRNPYHIFMPAWLMDNVRRGAELVVGQGEGNTDFTFATLARIFLWDKGVENEVLEKGKLLSSADDMMELLYFQMSSQRNKTNF